MQIDTDDFALFGHDLFGAPVNAVNGILAQKFTWPPFSILDARTGEWRERKRAWLALGIKSELGRDVEIHNNDWARAKGLSGLATGNTNISTFDPVLCELVYKWFCPAGGQVVDPFAGGSVRGIVAAHCGLQYWGCDLRQEQIDANWQQARAILPDAGARQSLHWCYGDAMTEIDAAPAADLIFTCPPYGDLEKYSNDSRDLSTMEYHTFLPALKRIILRSYRALKPNRFACIVVGDFRDSRTGNYRGFVADTVTAFRECGFELYNEAILATPIGSLPIRVSTQFTKSRKLGKAHQNLLVFVKGRPPRNDVWHCKPDETAEAAE